MGVWEIVAIVVGAFIVAVTVFSTIRRVKEMLWRKRVAKYLAEIKSWEVADEDNNPKY